MGWTRIEQAGIGWNGLLQVQTGSSGFNGLELVGTQ